MKENGLITPPVDAAPVLRKASTENKWAFSQVADMAYRHGDVMMDRFYHGIATPQFPGRLPTPVFAVDALNKRTLGAYNLVPDGYGLPFRITLNEAHFIDGEDGKKMWRWGDWSLNEVICHELLHHAQQLRGKDPYKAGKVTHNKEFCTKLEALGLHPTPGTGAHYAVADADSPFGLLMREWGIERPMDVPREEVGKKNWWTIAFGDGPVGRSSLTMYACALCGLKVRVGIKSDPQLIHEPDGGKFVRG